MLIASMSHACRLNRWRSSIVAALLLAGCGGSAATSAHQSRTTATDKPAVPTPGELLSVPAVGRLYGRCQPGAARWTIEFAAAPNAATDSITSRIGSGRPRTVNVNPGSARLIWRLVPGRYLSHEPANRASGFPAAAIKTTEPISIAIEQGTEPHIFYVDIRLAVAAAIGDTANCAPVSSSLSATTYYPGGQPPR